MPEQQPILTEEEQELEEAEKQFEEENKTIAAQQSGEPTKEETVKRYQGILTALGFTPHYHDKDQEGNDETNFGIRIMDTKIGVKFNDKNPAGKVWAYVLTEDNKKEFIKNGNLKQLPLVQRYSDIQAGKKPIPEITVTGRIIERRSKSVVVEIEEDREKKEIIFGWGAVKRHDDGHHFIPHGFSKPSQDNPEGKMWVPRDILLPEMDPQPENREEQGRAPAAPAEATPAQPPAAKPTVKKNLTVPELIVKYTEMLALVTEAISAEGRIPEREKGYGIKFVFYSVKDALENGKGGDHEEA